MYAFPPRGNPIFQTYIHTITSPSQINHGIFVHILTYAILKSDKSILRRKKDEKKNLVVKPQNHKNWKSGLKLSNFGFLAFAWILIGLSLIEELYLKINWKLSFVGERLLHLKLIHNAINPLNLSEGRTDRNTWFHSRQSMYSPIDWSSTNFHFSLSLETNGIYVSRSVWMRFL